MFEAPDEKQVNPQASNSYVMPDLSSQTGMVGFNLGALSTIDDTSMNSNGSFDVSVRNSDMSGSAYSSEGSFATSEADDHTNPNATSAVPFVQAVFSAGHSGSAQQQNYANILDEDDDVDEDSLDDDDGEDDAVTMELTGTVDMGAIDDGDSDNDLGTSISISGGGLNARDARHDQSVQSSSLSNLIASGTQLVSNTNTEQILNALLQSNTASQDTSLLDNIILQFSQHPQSQSHQQQQQQPESPNGNIQNTMELDYTRVDPSVGMEDIYDRDTTIQPDTTLSVRPAFSANDSRTGANGASLPEYEMDVDSSDDDNINEDAITMELTGVVSRDIVALQSNPVPEVTENQGSDSKIGKSIKADAASVFELDPLPHIPLEMQDLPYPKSPGSSILADQAKAGLVFDIYNAYRYQQHIPQISADAAEMTVVDAKFEPLYRKAKLTARLEYCSSLVSLFESDQAISRLEDAAITDFGQKVAFFSEANEVLLERKDELVMRLAKLKSRIAEESSAGNTGRLSVETKELREKLAAIKSMREETSAKADQLSCEIRALQTTNSSFDRQVTEKKSAQKLLLAINGLQLADVSESSCEFVYDKFSKLHLDGAAEFTSLHPDINWNAIVRDAINRDNLTLRQYAISIMRLNAILNDLLDDVKRVKRHTFVDVFCNDGIQVRMQLFSKELRRRFYLHVPLKSVESYKTLHSEPEFDWSTEAVYGNVDQEKLRAEARVYKSTIDGKPVVAKQRFSKTYRHPELDKKLTRGRLNQEVRSLKRCREHGIRVPEVVRQEKESATLYMQYIDGQTLKEWILCNDNEDKEKEYMLAVGRILHTMHCHSIVHGDLTTSNMIIDKDGEVVLIDFGLSQISSSAEDKAVDLYVLERAFISTHPNSTQLFTLVLDAYDSSDMAKSVLRRLDDVRQRGRKRDMTG
ncbi:TP53 regulating kinase [Coemansia sp. RSA 1285]|nr:TP53 regulating kinase [Coemansia sp. RSA 1285]